MKILPRLLLAALILAAGQGILRADGGYSFGFTLDPQHDEGTDKTTRAMSSKVQNWFYNVTIDNKSFKDIPNLQVKYVVFASLAENGKDKGLQRHPGETAIKLLANGGRATFSTDSILLRNIRNFVGYTWMESEKGTLSGIWLRVFVDGKMVAEYMDPPDLSTRESFDLAKKN